MSCGNTGWLENKIQSFILGCGGRRFKYANMKSLSYTFLLSRIVMAMGKNVIRKNMEIISWYWVGVVHLICRNCDFLFH